MATAFRLRSLAKEKRGDPQPAGFIFGLCLRHRREYRPPITHYLVVAEDALEAPPCALCLGPPHYFPDESGGALGQTPLAPALPMRAKSYREATR